MQHLGGNGLRTEARSHEVRLMPLCTVHAATVGTVLIPGRHVVLRLVRNVAGRLLVVVLIVGWLRQGWEAEHGATRVALRGSPGSGRTIVLRRGGAGGGRRCGRVVRRSPRVVVSVATVVVRRHGRLGRGLVCWSMVGLLHGQRWKGLVRARIVRAAVH